MQSLTEMAGSLANLPVIVQLRSLLPIHHQWGWEFQPVTFSQPLVLWLIPLAALVVWLIYTQVQPPLVHTRVPHLERSWGANIFTAVVLAFSLLITGIGLALLIAACALPTHLEATPDSMEQSTDIHIAIETTATNMAEGIGTSDHLQEPFGIPPLGNCGVPSQWGTRKLDLSAWAACDIAAAFPKYRKTLATFDGSTQCCSPAANSDPRYFDQRVREVIKKLGDTNTNYDSKDGVFNVMLDFIREKSKSESRVLIVLTDGDAEVTEENIEAYARAMSDLKVTLICGGPGQDTVATDPPTDTLVQLCHRAGGTIINFALKEGMEKTKEIIRNLPPSPVMNLSKAEPRPVQGPFILLGVVCLITGSAGLALLGRLR